MEKAWEKAVEAARAGQDPSETVSLTLDGALKCSQCRLPPPALFEQFSRLQHLSIANAGLTSLEGFPCLPHLKRLVLSDNRIAGGLEYLVQAGLRSLQDLDLSNNRLQGFDDLAPLSQLNLVSLDLYECPVTRLPDYSARVFGIVKSLQYLDKTDVDGKERFESDDDCEELDSEDEEDVDDFNGEDKSNGFRTGNPAVDEDEEEFDEEDEEDELDVEEEDEYQDGVTINGHGAAPGHLAAAVAAGNSSEDDEVEDEDDCDNAEVQDLEEEDDGESDEVAEAEDDDAAGVAEDEEDEDGTEQVSGAPGELDIQEDDDNVEDEDGELGDEEEDDEGVENDAEDDGEEEEEDYGTEYLVQPIGKPEDDEGGSDFEPVEGDGEDDDLDEDEDDDNYIVGNQKRSRDRLDNDSDDEDRNPKRR